MARFGWKRSGVSAAILAMTAMMGTAGAAQTATDSRKATERDILKRAVEIPTVQGRGQMDEMTKMLSIELRKAGNHRHHNSTA